MIGVEFRTDVVLVFYRGFCVGKCVRFGENWHFCPPYARVFQKFEGATPEAAFEAYCKALSLFD